ncbi:cytochrome ubiquinol oxidase subunit II [Sulfoacidibacillus thermotolerans]|uniref:Quinol oxidase subunit 2 n=2 Tax=Sulfoacidibacillus thermotolerans TaxID=1765684 RepID=A0A2U3D8I6_SULT2|nr:cytochrome ubiquinol oxidase subunit II [Sulfoacidibacillus thermotolerans]
MQKRTGTYTLIAALCATLFLLPGCGEQVLVFHPVGPVGQVEKQMIILSIVMVSIVVIPVIALLWVIVVRYRDTPDNPTPYRPEWSESRTLEFLWWAVPIVIIGVLGFVTVQKTFALVRPPGKVINPLTIQVTSLDWKWLFQYPGQKIATVNYCEIPANRPIEFVLTSNAPMNSFWVPQLGGQEYTMPGMAMKLWLEADQPGVYFGSGANFSGEGFSHMHFHVIARPQSDFDHWVQRIKSTAPPLTTQQYAVLAQRTIVQPMSFSTNQPGLFEKIVSQDGGMYMRRDLMKGKVNTHVGTD